MTIHERRHPTGHPTHAPNDVRQRRLDHVQQRIAQLQRERSEAIQRRASVIECLSAVPAVIVPCATILSVYAPVWVTVIVSLAGGPVTFCVLRRLLPDEQPLPCERCLASFAEAGSYCSKCGHERPAIQQRPWRVNQVGLLTVHVLLVLALGVITFRIGRVVGWALPEHPVLSMVGGFSTVLFIGGLFGLYQWKSDPSEN